MKNKEQRVRKSENKVMLRKKRKEAEIYEKVWYPWCSSILTLDL